MRGAACDGEHYSRARQPQRGARQDAPQRPGVRQVEARERAWRVRVRVRARVRAKGQG